jgi:hypothetical protein
MEKCRLPDWEKEEIRLAKEMNKKYIELIFKHALQGAKDKFGWANSFLLRSGVFIDKNVRVRSQKLLDLIWNAIIETEVNHEIEHTAR